MQHTSPNRIPKETLLATFDFESLYTNIPHNLGIEAIKFLIEQFSGDFMMNDFQKIFLLKHFRKLYNFNLMMFFFRQKKGTAMDMKVAPTYATLTIGYLEQKLYNNITAEFG